LLSSSNGGAALFINCQQLRRKGGEPTPPQGRIERLRIISNRFDVMHVYQTLSRAREGAFQ
jgi:hypothetical protein